MILRQVQPGAVRPAQAGGLGARLAYFGGYCLIVAVLHARVLMALYEYSRENATASHVILVPFVTLVLIYQRKEEIFARLGRDVAGGAAFLACGAGLSILALTLNSAARPEDQLAPWVAAFVCYGIGGFLIAFGRAAASVAVFPLFFLIFTVPMPSAVVDGLTRVLKVGSTEVVSALFTLTGTPFVREGFVFTLPTVAIEIADACSGIRSTIALVLTGLLAGYQFLSRGWTKFALCLAIIPVTFIKNGIRIVALTLLSVHVDPGYLTGELHREGGIAFFLLALGLLAIVLAVLRAAEGQRLIGGWRPRPVSDSP
jgi:exosortase